jgi:hypothetical protein
MLNSFKFIEDYFELLKFQQVHDIPVELEIGSLGSSITPQKTFRRRLTK